MNPSIKQLSSFTIEGVNIIARRQAMVRLYYRLMTLVSSIGLTCTDVNDGGFTLRIYGSRFLLIKHNKIGCILLYPPLIADELIYLTPDTSPSQHTDEQENEVLSLRKHIEQAQMAIANGGDWQKEVYQKDGAYESRFVFVVASLQVNDDKVKSVLELMVAVL
ncbi:unnamed protein product [Lactuca saligna]|uniref:Uncharacterized protein n=1 Tax=Lactuca saligna TaxID=75948 RepID=A0AA35V7I7_LACSI|nr:unnamed protein product [Lactuca saligna]